MSLIAPEGRSPSVAATAKAAVPRTAAVGTASANTASASQTAAGPAVLLSLSNQQKAADTRQNVIASLLSLLPTDVAKSLSDQQQKASDTVTALNNAKQSLVSDRKGAAQQKLDRARQKLQMLRMLGGDPKTVARQAKQIAQEIKAAASEYSAALKSEGGGADLAVSDIAIPTASAAVSAPAGPTAETASDTSGFADAAPVSAAAVTGEASSPPAAQTPAAAVPATKADAEADRQKAVQAYQDQAANIGAASDKARAEREALQAFKDVAREAKSLIEDAARKLKAKKPSDPDAAEAERAKAGLDDGIDELSKTVEASVSDAGVSAGYAVPVDLSTASAVDLLA